MCFISVAASGTVVGDRIELSLFLPRRLSVSQLQNVPEEMLMPGFCGIFPLTSSNTLACSTGPLKLAPVISLVQTQEASCWVFKAEMMDKIWWWRTLLVPPPPRPILLPFHPLPPKNTPCCNVPHTPCRSRLTRALPVVETPPVLLTGQLKPPHQQHLLIGWCKHSLCHICNTQCHCWGCSTGSEAP